MYVHLFSRNWTEPTTLTFNADDVIAYLCRHLAVVQQVDQMVDGIDRRVDALEALNLLPNGQRVVEQGLQMMSRPGAACSTTATTWTAPQPSRPASAAAAARVVVHLDWISLAFCFTRFFLSLYAPSSTSSDFSSNINAKIDNKSKADFLLLFTSTG